MAKVFVEVIAKFTKDGKKCPLIIKWEDGRSFDIDRITDIRRAASLKAGGQGIRYRCRINGRETYTLAGGGQVVRRKQDLNRPDHELISMLVSTHVLYDERSTSFAGLGLLNRYPWAVSQRSFSRNPSWALLSTPLCSHSQVHAVSQRYQCFYYLGLVDAV